MNHNFLIILTILSFWASQSKAQVRVQVNADGTKYSPILVNGSVGTKFNVVFLGDGITEDMQSNFNNLCRFAVDELLKVEPYRSRECSFNFWRVNVISQDPGIDEPFNNIFRNTELDAADQTNHFGTISTEKVLEAARNAPGFDCIVVFFNSRNLLFTPSASSPYVYLPLAINGRVMAHELGHSIALLSDEYQFVQQEFDAAINPEPIAPNITGETTRGRIKWEPFIMEGTSLPTEIDVPPGIVGLWDSAYYAKNCFRPQRECIMRFHNLAPGFCKVCHKVLTDRLIPYCPPYYDYEYARAQTVGLARTLDFSILNTRVFRRWPLPVCLTCPPIKVGKSNIKLQLSGIDTNTLEICIVDQNGVNIQAVVTQSKKNIDIEFTKTGNNEYFLQVIPKMGTKAGTKFSIEAKLFENGKEIYLQ